VGLAVTVAPEVEANPVEGDQEKVLEGIDELAVKLTDCPLQIEGVKGAIVTVGFGLTVTITSSDKEGQLPEAGIV
jgi:hypothetical protein